MNALRLLFVHGPSEDLWRAGFELAQAAAALDVPLELAFAGPGLDLIAANSDCGRRFASLELLGVDQVRVPSERVPNDSSTLPVQELSKAQWHHWLRAAALQVW